MTTPLDLDAHLEFGGSHFSTSRPHRFGLVIDRLQGDSNDDYLHQILLAPENRDAFLALIEREGLVVCRNVRTKAVSYRKVRGKSSAGKLSQAEYYHHDGCSCPTKPRIVEIRLPHQEITRNVATAIAPFSDVIRAMLLALPARLETDADLDELRELSRDRWELLEWNNPQCNWDAFPQPATWDRIQGRITRLVRRDLDAESSRAYFREVDRLAQAYDYPWEMGESRLMVNSAEDLTRTMQHRRAYQQPRQALEKNGSLVKRWTAEET